MARVSRYRQHFAYDFGDGYYIGAVNNNPIGGEAKYLASSGIRMDDKVGRPISDGTLSYRRFDKTKLGHWSGSVNQPGDPTWTVYHDMPIPHFHGIDLTWYPYTLVYPDLQTVSYYNTAALARSNPSRPEFVPGELIRDLVDLPKMIKSIGDLLRTGYKKRGFAHEAANRYLESKFGWAPLFHDIEMLLDVYKYIDRRNEEVNRLYGANGLKRRIKFGRHTAFATGTIFALSGNSGQVTETARQYAKLEYYATVRWKPTIPPKYYPNHSKMLADAKRAVLGATASGGFASSWDLIPWTWMLGWVTNVRDYVIAHGNTFPCAPGTINRIGEHDIVLELEPTSHSSWLHGTGGSISYTYKTRNIGTGASISAYPPYLKAGRLSTLAALGVQRFR